MAHTKGRWYKSGLDIRQDDGMAGAHRILAQIQTDVGMKAANANADLIAAAPQLLAACKTRLEEWHSNEYNFGRLEPASVQLARFAIDRAEGR